MVPKDPNFLFLPSKPSTSRRITTQPEKLSRLVPALSPLTLTPTDIKVSVRESLLVRLYVLTGEVGSCGAFQNSSNKPFVFLRARYQTSGLA